MYLFYPFFLIIPVLVLIFRGRYFVRFISIASNPIGHFSIETELNSVKFQETVTAFRKRYPESKLRFYLFFYRDGRVSNKTLYSMLKKSYFFVHPILGKISVLVLRKLSLYSHAPHIFKSRNIDLKDVFSDIPNPLILKTKSSSKARLRSLPESLNLNKPFICVLNRESTYHESFNPGVDHHNHHRNVHINDFIPMITHFNHLGLQVIRMGSNMSQDIQYNHDLFFDYSKFESRCDFLDIFLTAHCEFFVSVGTGLDSIAHQFRRPVYYCSQAPLSHVWVNKKTIFLPKLLLSSVDDKILSLRSPMFKFAKFIDRNELLESYKLKYIPNTKDEIEQLAIEIIDFHFGKFELNENQIKLQNLFWECYPFSSNLHYKNFHKSVISPYFLQKYAHLLT
jgi:putative glycosyltransferase (TIGR04372 family)